MVIGTGLTVVPSKYAGTMTLKPNEETRAFKTANTVMKHLQLKGEQVESDFRVLHTPLRLRVQEKARAVNISTETTVLMAYKTRTYTNEVEFAKVDELVALPLLTLLAVDTYFVAIGLISVIPLNP